MGSFGVSVLAENVLVMDDRMQRLCNKKIVCRGGFVVA